MVSTLLPLTSLFSGTALLLAGTGLFATLLSVRGALEGFSSPALGLVVSAYFTGFLAGTWICPKVLQRVGHIRAYALFAAIASITPIWSAMLVDVWVWGALRLVSGICLLGLYTVIESWLNAQAPNEHRGRVFSIYMVVNFLAIAAGQFLLLLRPPSDFDLFGVVATLFSLSLVPIMLTNTPQPARSTTPRLPVLQLFHTAPAAVLGACGSGLATGAFWGLGPVLAQQLGGDAASVAVYMSAAILGGAALQWPIGSASDRHPRERILGIVALASALLALAGWGLSEGPREFLLLSTFAWGGSAFSLYSISVAHLNDRLPPGTHVQGSSSLLLLHGIGAAIGPTIAGVVMHVTGAAGLMLYFAGVLLVLGILVLRVSGRPAPLASTTRSFVPMLRTTPTALELLPDEIDLSEARSDPDSPRSPGT